MKNYIFILACLLLAYVGKAQELQMKVFVDVTQMQTQQASEKGVLKTNLERTIKNFVNTFKWTKDEFRKEEQIKCELKITLTKSPAQNIFEGNAVVRAFRPIYNTTHESLTIMYIDRFFNFNYMPEQPLIYAKNVYTDDLSSMLAFYANVILAIDYDSFSKGGGAQYAEEAFNIVNIAQGSGNNGWSRQGNTLNRYWLAENLQSQQMIPFREAFYSYHLLGLDTFLKDPEKARQEIYKSLEAIDAVNKLKPSAVFTNIFFDAKGLEIVNIFLPTPLEMRKKVHNFLVRLDPNKAGTYNKLLE